MVTLRADVARCQQGCWPELSFDGELIFLGIRQDILVPKRGRGSDRQVICPVDHRAGRGQGDWKSLPFNVSTAAVYKRSDKLGRYRTAIENAERSIPDFVEVCRALERA